jgi:molecular chaperone GrpE
MENSEKNIDDNKLSDTNDKVENTDNEQADNHENKNLSTEDKLKETEEKLLRIMAEMENQRRRFEKERNDAFEFGGYNFAKESLSLLDNMDRAILSFKENDNFKKNDDFNKIIDGIEIVKNDLVSIFKKNGIELIKCKDEKFDPNFHQAMLEVVDDKKDAGTVVQEIQKGYMMKDRLLRPSLVGVTKKSTPNEPKSSKEENKLNKD